MIRAYAESTSGGKSVGSGTKLGQETIRKNMTKAGATKKQINAALKRGQKLNGQVTRV